MKQVQPNRVSTTPPKSSSTALLKHTPMPGVVPATPQDRLEHIEDWTKLSDEARKRRGMVAANRRDLDELKSMLGAYFNLYGDKGLGSHPKTLKLYLKALEELLELLPGENLLRPSKDMGVLFMRKLQARVVEEHGKRKHLAPSTMNVKLYGVKTFYKALRWATGIEARPFDDVSPIPDPTDPAEKRLPYKPKEVEKLLEVCGEDLRLKAIILLGCHGGLRIHEVAKLAWRDVQWARQTFTIVGKGGKKARVRMSNRLLETLSTLKPLEDEQKRRQARLGKVLPYAEDRIRQLFRSLCQRAGVEYDERAFHATRHFAGEQTYQRSDKNLSLTAAHLRHENLRHTRRYSKIGTDQTASVVDTL
jgi:integrase